jgi:ABC-2 type transport system ATP-binding protein
MTDEKVIQLRSLEKTYLDFWRRPTVHALRGLDLDVSRGEIFGLLGPNGSGKSTTIKLLLGLIAPTAGTVSIFGKPPSDVAVKNRLGYLPEVSNLHRFLTPSETLRYYAGLFGLDAKTAKRRCEELLRMVGLEKAANREIGQFSKGMARRVGLAQSLINNPDLVVLDEPTSGLDPIAGRAVKDWIRALAASGKTIFLTSHLLADVEDICDRVAIICDGALRAEGRVSELLQRPDAIRFTVKDLPADRADSVRDGLASVAGAKTEDISIDRPRVNLETFFLDVVAEADAESGGGAVRTSDLAPFLTEGVAHQ